MSGNEIKSNSNKTDLISKIKDDFSPLIELIFKATDNFLKINTDNLNEINKILLSIENNYNQLVVIKLLILKIF